MPLVLTTTSSFPGMDPIPLPAPVWLFKALLDLTLVLHFAALYLFLGGLTMALVLNARGHTAADAGRVVAAGRIAAWLPVIMTYVINLGIPPLLFAQVLYGRALYTSSVLIGGYWIAVIPLLIACYHLLYVMKARSEEGRPFVRPAVGSLLLAWAIARIYSANMTLMLDPGLWRAAYAADQSGSVLNSGPAAWARWGYMLSAGLAGAGVLAAWLGRGVDVSAAATAVLRRAGAWSALFGSLLAAVTAIAAWSQQPTNVQEVCNSSNAFWVLSAAAWGIGLVGVVLFAAAMLQSGGPVGVPLLALGSLGAFVQTAGYVVCRDLVRDASLAAFGFDVWDRAVAVNWSVLVLFFVLFVAGLGVVAWLGSVAYRAKTKVGEVA